MVARARSDRPARPRKRGERPCDRSVKAPRPTKEAQANSHWAPCAARVRGPPGRAGSPGSPVRRIESIAKQGGSKADKDPLVRSHTRSDHARGRLLGSTVTPVSSHPPRSTWRCIDRRRRNTRGYIPSHCRRNRHERCAVHRVGRSVDRLADSLDGISTRLRKRAGMRSEEREPSRIARLPDESRAGNASPGHSRCSQHARSQECARACKHSPVFDSQDRKPTRGLSHRGVRVPAARRGRKRSCLSCESRDRNSSHYLLQSDEHAPAPSPVRSDRERLEIPGGRSSLGLKRSRWDRHSPGRLVERTGRCVPDNLDRTPSRARIQNRSDARFWEREFRRTLRQPSDTRACIPNPFQLLRGTHSQGPLSEHTCRRLAHSRARIPTVRRMRSAAHGPAECLRTRTELPPKAPEAAPGSLHARGRCG
jgi:hypothetical protein